MKAVWSCVLMHSLILLLLHCAEKWAKAVHACACVSELACYLPWFKALCYIHKSAYQEHSVACCDALSLSRLKITRTYTDTHTQTNMMNHSHVHQAFGSRAAWQPGSECVKHKPSLIFHHLETNPFGKQWQATAVCFVPSELLIMLCLKSVQRVLMRTSETRN